jgi:hypothetical protein
LLQAPGHAAQAATIADISLPQLQECRTPANTTLPQFLGTTKPQAIYLFAGPHRQSDVGSMLREKGWDVNEIDILRDSTQDLTLPAVSNSILSDIRSGKYKALLASPPCDTFTRVKYANARGPAPQRSHQWPRGFSWLAESDRRQVMLANSLADTTIEALEAQLETKPGLLVFEFPEDLGAVRNGEWKGVRPASIFQFPRMKEIMDNPLVRNGALLQQDFGTDYAKPTRLVLRLPEEVQLDPRIYLGLPTFDEQGYYTGPVPHQSGAQGLARGAREPGFRTTGTAAWPMQLCQVIADMLQAAVQSDASNSHHIAVEEVEVSVMAEAPGENKQPPKEEGRDTLTQPPEEEGRETYKVTMPPADYLKGGWGNPRRIDEGGQLKSFHDGGGLTSPGRFNREQRTYPIGKRWDLLRSKVAQATLGELSNTDVVKHIAALSLGKDIFPHDKAVQVRGIIHKWLGKQCGDYPTDKEPVITEGQPFYLELLYYLTREMVDADFEIIRDYMEGVTLGILQPLPRTPAIFEEQTRWKLNHDPLVNAALENSNYRSFEEFADAVEEQFQQEEKEGMMQFLDEDEFYREFGNNIAIAALAVLEEKDKIRVLHDGSNEVRANHKIKCRDKQRMPGVREKHYLLDDYRRRGKVAIAILGDVSKAHRRVKVARCEQGFQACRTRRKGVWINKVGTFGMSSASYWWARLFAIIVRATHALLGQAFMLDFLTFADDFELIAQDRGEYRSILLAITIFLALGVPIKWKKFRGGYSVSWIGLAVDYRQYMMGITEERAAWLCKWISTALAEGMVHVRDFAGVVGRLNFVVAALHYEKPLLGILYMWLGAITGATFSKAVIPWAVQLSLAWIKKRLEGGGRMEPAPTPFRKQDDWFRSDAKAEGGRAWIGGWCSKGGSSTRSAAWYSLEVTREWAPWVWAKASDPGRVIAALELLGTIVSIMVFCPMDSAGMEFEGCLTGATDNQGNMFATQRFLSTKWPLTVLLIELAEQLRARRARLVLNWRRRSENQEADDLTNADFSKFDSANRIEIDPHSIPWIALSAMMAASEELYQSIVKRRAEPKQKYVLKGSFKKVRKKGGANKLKFRDPW